MGAIATSYTLHVLTNGRLPPAGAFPASEFAGAMSFPVEALASIKSVNLAPDSKKTRFGRRAPDRAQAIQSEEILLLAPRAAD
jgi:hypothetical protein